MKTEDKARAISDGAEKLAKEYTQEGDFYVAHLLRKLTTLPLESRARLFDILVPEPKPLGEILGATENVGSVPNER